MIIGVVFMLLLLLSNYSICLYILKNVGAILAHFYIKNMSHWYWTLEISEVQETS